MDPSKAFERPVEARASDLALRRLKGPEKMCGRMHALDAESTRTRVTRDGYAPERTVERGIPQRELLSPSRLTALMDPDARGLAPTALPDACGHDWAFESPRG